MGHKNNAKHAFWYMLSLVALIFLAIASGQAIFQIINKTIADLTTGGFGQDTSMLKFAISALIISIPLYFLTMRQIEKSLAKGEIEKDSPIRRWLTYVILLVSSIVMIVWLIGTINNFLGGELSSRFALKALTAIVLSAIIFSYYLYDIRRESIKKRDWVVMTYLIAALVITVGSLVASFFFVESPAAARARRHDNDGVLNRFTQIDGTINTYYTNKKSVPENLGQLSDENLFLPADTLKDPTTGRSFEYKKIDAMTYQLCAEFNTSNKEQSPDGYYNYSDRWAHDAGYQCLKQKVSIIANDVMQQKQMAVPASR